MTTQAQRNSYRRDAERRAAYAASGQSQCKHCFGHGGAWVILGMENNEPHETRAYVSSLTSAGPLPIFEVCAACNGTGRSQ